MGVWNLLCFCGAVLLLVLPTRVHAQTYTTPLTDAEIDRRMAAANQMLQSQKPSADYWEYGWGTFNGASMVYNSFEAARADNRKDRNTDAVQAVESLIGLADVIFRPLPAYNANVVCTKPIRTQQDRIDCLTAQEEMLQHSAARAHQPYELMPHLGNLAFNLAAGALVLGLADTRHALWTFVPGEVVGEIQLWTQPMQPMNDLGRYKMSFSPMLKQDNARTPAAGLIFRFSF